MNTGGQRSGATPKWARTTNTPIGSVIKGKPQWGKDMIAIMEAHEIPYIAQASVAYMKDFKRKVEKAVQVSSREKRGLSYIEVLNTCPTGWGYPEDQMINLARLAVQTGYWPLFEIEDGRFTLNRRPKELKPVREYLNPQGRFRHLTEEQITMVEDRIKKRWERLLKRADEG
jgi:pyruvate ferredoxin oxidoreductase beta subunit